MRRPPDEERRPTGELSGVVDPRHESEPTVAELRRSGRVRRVVVRRDVTAQCIQCGVSWPDAHAITHATRHAERAGHVIEASYSASYVYVATAHGGVL